MSYKMSEILQVPVVPDATEAESELQVAPTEPLEAEPPLSSASENVPKAKKMGRPVGKKDAKPRAKPKPKSKPVRSLPQVEEVRYESSSEDEATAQELHALHLMRAVRSYDQGRAQQKYDKYASWFGR
jgi:hypothetical protein